MIMYNKFDERGYTQVYTARWESGGWIVHQTTDWTDRWELAGSIRRPSKRRAWAPRRI